MKYRSEIDGLRALAVVPVILFHAGFKLFSGGFVGVDVFFVVSGYLITTIIIDDIENQRFSIIKFYERRARRILPALFLVMLVCIPFSWMWMLPNQMEDFSRSLLAVSVFASNILFWRESGYFSAAAEEIPLLHTWSLAVEEQYYVLFPIFLILAWRFGKRKVFWMIVVLSGLSLLLSEWGWRNRATANFYLAPTRAWELLAGSIAAFIVQKHGVQKSNSLALVGLAGIIFSIFFYNQNTPFPSLYALAPVVGTVFLLLFANKETFVARLLSTKGFVAIGLISYSAYLWHQPVFALAKIKYKSAPSDLILILLAISSLVLAYFTWRFVENPFRASKKMTRMRVFLFSSVGIFVFLVTGFLGHKTGGFMNQMIKFKFTDAEQPQVALVLESINYDIYEKMEIKDCHIWVRDTNDINARQIDDCFKKYGKSIIVLGDSHAMNLFNIISASNAYPFLVGVSKGGCRPHDNRVDCHYDNFDQFAKKHTQIIDLIIYHQSGSYFISDINGAVSSQTAFEGGFGWFNIENIDKVLNYLKELQKSTKKEVIWVGPFLEYRRNPSTVMLTKAVGDVNPISIKLFNQLDKLLSANGSRGETLTYVPFNRLFFEPKTSFHGNCFVFRDADHYSKCGERLISRSFNKDALGLVQRDHLK